MAHTVVFSHSVLWTCAGCAAANRMSKTTAACRRMLLSRFSLINSVSSLPHSKEADFGGFSKSPPGRHPEKGTHVKVGFTSYRKLKPGRQNTKSHHCGFRALLATLHAKEHDGGDEQQRRRRDAAACRADAQWGRRSRNSSHSPARQRLCRPPAVHPLSGGEAGQVAQGAWQGRRHARQVQGCRQCCDCRVSSQHHTGQYCACC